jgi:hypothetical protein
MEIPGVSDRRRVHSGRESRSNADAVDMEVLARLRRSDYAEGDGRGGNPASIFNAVGQRSNARIGQLYAKRERLSSCQNGKEQQADRLYNLWSGLIVRWKGFVRCPCHSQKPTSLKSLLLKDQVKHLRGFLIHHNRWVLAPFSRKLDDEKVWRAAPPDHANYHAFCLDGI